MQVFELQLRFFCNCWGAIYNVLCCVLLNESDCFIVSKQSCTTINYESNSIAVSKHQAQEISVIKKKMLD